MKREEVFVEIRLNQRVTQSHISASILLCVINALLSPMLSSFFGYEIPEFLNLVLLSIWFYFMYFFAVPIFEDTYISFQKRKHDWTIPLSIGILVSIALLLTENMTNLSMINMSIFTIGMFRFVLVYYIDMIGEPMQALSPTVPTMCTVRKDEGDIRISREDIKENDIILVHPLETIPVHGYVIEGSSYIDDHYISGKRQPSYKKIGDRVYAGSVNGSDILYITPIPFEDKQEPKTIVDQYKETRYEDTKNYNLFYRYERLLVTGYYSVISIATLLFFLFSKDITETIYFLMTTLFLPSFIMMYYSEIFLRDIYFASLINYGIFLQKPERLESIQYIDAVILHDTQLSKHNTHHFVNVLEKQGISIMDISKSKVTHDAFKDTCAKLYQKKRYIAYISDDMSYDSPYISLRIEHKDVFQVSEADVLLLNNDIYALQVFFDISNELQKKRRQNAVFLMGYTVLACISILFMLIQVDALSPFLAILCMIVVTILLFINIDGLYRRIMDTSSK